MGAGGSSWLPACLNGRRLVWWHVHSQGYRRDGNFWHLNLDPEIYGADAAHFNPARFLDAHGDISPGPPDTKKEGHVTYGFGRRVCVGKHVENNSLFIDIAMTLWACNIEPGKDGRGDIIPIDVDGCVEDGLAV